MRHPSSVIRVARRARRGFTLIEAAIVTVIIGVGVVGMLQLLATGTVANGKGTDLTTAINLANNVREISLGLPFYDKELPTVWNTREGTVAAYDNVLDLDGTGTDAASYQEFSPPLDVRREGIAAYQGWTQRVMVNTVAQDQISSTRPDTTVEPTVRVTAIILKRNVEVYRTSWLVVAPNPASI